MYKALSKQKFPRSSNPKKIYKKKIKKKNIEIQTNKYKLSNQINRKIQMSKYKLSNQLNREITLIIAKLGIKKYQNFKTKISMYKIITKRFYQILLQMI